MSKNTTFFRIDVLQLAVLMATILTVSTDLFVHSFIHVILGVSVCVIALWHISLHWGWIRNISQRYDRLPEPTRSNARLNGGLACGYILCASAGISSRAMLFPFHLHVFLGVIHACLAVLVIVLQVIHISRHWKWIKAMARKKVVE